MEKRVFVLSDRAKNNINMPPIIRRLPQGKATPYRVSPFNILAIL